MLTVILTVIPFNCSQCYCSIDACTHCIPIFKHDKYKHRKNKWLLFCIQFKFVVILTSYKNCMQFVITLRISACILNWMIHAWQSIATILKVCKKMRWGTVQFCISVTCAIKWPMVTSWQKPKSGFHLWRFYALLHISKFRSHSLMNKINKTGCL